MTKWDRVLERIHKEQKAYYDRIEKLPPRAIINKAYEMCYRDELMIILENTEFSDEVYEKLLSETYILEFLYDEWLDADVSICQELEDIIERVVI